jgi:adenylate cyclase
MPGQPANERLWRSLWTGAPPIKIHRARRIFRYIPTGPRCKLCYAPFRGIGGPIMRLLGCQPSPKNPNFCNTCGTFAARHPGGAEIELSILFADVRGSTAMAESMTPASFQERMSRFHTVATGVLIGAEAMLDKIVGDEVGGLFLPIVAGRRHARVAVQAAQDLVLAVAGKAHLPVGVGVHTGIAYLGTVEGAGGSVRDIAALGDTVNTAARLASAAAAGRGPAQRSRIRGMRVGLARATATRARAQGQARTVPGARIGRRTGSSEGLDVNNLGGAAVARAWRSSRRQRRHRAVKPASRQRPPTRRSRHEGGVACVNALT